MSTDIAIDAIRLALRVQELRAEVASTNIANASTPGAQTLRMDFATAQRALADAAQDNPGAVDALRIARTALADTTAIASPEEIVLDQQVGDLVSAGTDYQALSEALSRQLGLMRLAITGRS